VRVASFGEVDAVADLAELISLCAQRRAEGADGDGAAWAATAAFLGRGDLAPARDALRVADDDGPLVELARSAAGQSALEQALASHRARLG
jgi:hypothetical protein